MPYNSLILIRAIRIIRNIRGKKILEEANHG
jgi:hypothetical protein